LSLVKSGAMAGAANPSAVERAQRSAAKTGLGLRLVTHLAAGRCRRTVMKPATDLASTKPARPRRPTGRTAAAPRVSDAASPASPNHEERVREAAYFIYERNGRAAGRELENWLEAEAQLLREEAQAANRESPAD
jgi:hypothetical protein